MILIYTDPRDAHLIGGQGSSFVGADHIRTTESFDTRKVPHDRVLLSHFFGSKSETCSNHSSEALWDSGDCKCYSDFEVVDGTVEHTAVGWVPEVLEVDDPDEDTNDGDDFGKHVTKIVQLAFEGRLLVDVK